MSFSYFDSIPTDLSCYTDYNHSISCMWNSTHEHQDSACTLEAVRQHRYDKSARAGRSRAPFAARKADHGMFHRNKINSSCQLRSEDPSSPVHKTCTLPFKYKYTVSHRGSDPFQLSEILFRENLRRFSDAFVAWS